MKILLIFLLVEYVLSSVWFPVFVAFSGNGRSVFDSWKHQSLCSTLPAPFKTIGKSKHLRSPVIDMWNYTNIEMVKVEFYQSKKMVAWMKFNAQNTDNLNWFNNMNLQESSFNDLTPCNTFNFFSIYGETREIPLLDRKFFVNRHYGGCDYDYGWFIVADKYLACPWERKGPPPVLLYTVNHSSRNWNRDSRIADTMIISILADL